MEWWGYLHTEGTIQVKRVLWDIELCLQEANLSPFVKQVFPPFNAKDREKAIKHIKVLLL